MAENLHKSPAAGGMRTVEEDVAAADVDTDGSGDVTVTVGSLRHVESASAEAADGYTANVQSTSGNTVTVRVFQSAGSAAAHAAVTSSTDVTALTVTARGY